MSARTIMQKRQSETLRRTRARLVQKDAAELVLDRLQPNVLYGTLNYLQARGGATEREFAKKAPLFHDLLLQSFRAQRALPGRRAVFVRIACGLVAGSELRAALESGRADACHPSFGAALASLEDSGPRMALWSCGLPQDGAQLVALVEDLVRLVPELDSALAMSHALSLRSPARKPNEVPLLTFFAGLIGAGVEAPRSRSSQNYTEIPF